jgi:hypothetical protein
VSDSNASQSGKLPQPEPIVASLAASMGPVEFVLDALPLVCEAPVEDDEPLLVLVGLVVATDALEPISVVLLVPPVVAEGEAHACDSISGQTSRVSRLDVIRVSEPW